MLRGYRLHRATPNFSQSLLTDGVPSLVNICRRSVVKIRHGSLPKPPIYFELVDKSPGPLRLPSRSPAKSRKLGCLRVDDAPPRCNSSASRTRTLLGMRRRDTSCAIQRSSFSGIFRESVFIDDYVGNTKSSNVDYFPFPTFLIAARKRSGVHGVKSTRTPVAWRIAP